MTSGWRIVCSDGISRHTELFPTRRDALTWQTFRHVCPFGHHPPRREAEWEVESFRLRPRRTDVGTGSAYSRPPGEHPAQLPVPTLPVGAH